MGRVEAYDGAELLLEAGCGVGIWLCWEEVVR